MNSGIIGAGKVCSAVGNPLAKAGHLVLWSWSRDEAKLRALVAQTPGASCGSPADAVALVVMFVSGDDDLAKRRVATLVSDAGFDPYDLGTVAESGKQQPGGCDYGEEFHLSELPSQMSFAENGP